MRLLFNFGQHCYNRLLQQRWALRKDMGTLNSDSLWNSRTSVVVIVLLVVVVVVVVVVIEAAVKEKGMRLTHVYCLHDVGLDGEVYVSMYVRSYVCMSACMYVFISVCMYIRLYESMYVCMYVCMCA